MGKLEEALKLARVNDDPKRRTDKRCLVEAEKLYPCLMAICGSGFGLLIVIIFLPIKPIICVQLHIYCDLAAYYTANEISRPQTRLEI